MTEAAAAPRAGLGSRLALAAYAVAFGLLLPAVFLRYLWRARREPGYRQALGERLGLIAPLAPGAVWVHAVSLGETRAAAPLIEALRASLPGMRLLLTHGTATGREAGLALLRPGDAQAWLPLDTPGSVRRFMARARPAVGVLMETEVWPMLLAGAHAAGVPMVLANARLSAKSAARGRRLRALLRPAAQVFDLVLAQSEEDAGRLAAMGARRVEVCGNLKFDLQPAAALLELGRAWRTLLDRPVVLAAITREGEEALLLQHWQPFAVAGRPALLVIVPRHPQRFDEVAQRISAQGLRLARRSTFGARPSDADLAADAWLGDTLGEMALYYGLADIALLGGSYAPLGGHNLIEAAACGCPLLIGPSTFNFAEAARQALEAGAAWQVPDMSAALSRARELPGTQALQQAAERAAAFAGRHRGAARCMARRIAGRVTDPLSSRARGA